MNRNDRTARRPFPLYRGAAIAALFAAIAAGAALPAAAHDHGRGGHGGPYAMGAPWMGAPEHVARRVDRMLEGLNVGDAERARIREIAQTAAADLGRQREAGRTMREETMRIFTAPTIDAAAAERQRAQMLAHHDAVSRRAMQAMLDIAAVLTPEQRVALAQRFAERGRHMGRHGHDGHGRGERMGEGRGGPPPARP